jgi:ABC-type transport system substrate-binding protein
MGTYFNHHPNYEAYKNILEVATSTADTTVRTKLYKAVQTMSVQDVPWIPLWAMTDEMVMAWLPNVHGCSLNITMDIHIDRIWKD